MDCIDNINSRLTEEDLHEDANQDIVLRVVNKIRSGGSTLKKHLETGEIKISDMVRAVKNKRCLRTADQDFGTTYIEQVIGTAIRDVIPVDHINHARSLFGLRRLPPSELVRKKQQEITRQQPNP